MKISRTKAGPRLRAALESDECLVFVARPPTGLLELTRKPGLERWIPGRTAFSAAVHRIERTGGDPVLGSYFPSIFSLDWPNKALWALRLPRRAVVWMTPRVEKALQGRDGLLYALFPRHWQEAAVLFDAAQVREAYRVPDALAEGIVQAMRVLQLKYLSKMQFKGAYKDLDREVARAAMEAVLSLRVPTVDFGRPYLDRPMKFSFGKAKKGDRVLLLDGQVVRLHDLREVGADVAARFWRGNHQNFTTWDMKPWGFSHGPFSMSQVTPDMVARVLKKDEKRPDATATWKKNRKKIEAIYDAHMRRLVPEPYGESWTVVPGLCQYGEDCEQMIAPDIARELAKVRLDLALLGTDEPPWKQRHLRRIQAAKMPMLTDR